MRGMAMVALTFGALVLGGQSSARADVEYPYCLEPSAFTVGTCTFESFEQCMASASGNVGVCVKNPRYVAPAVVPEPVQPAPPPQPAKRQSKPKQQQSQQQQPPR